MTKPVYKFGRSASSGREEKGEGLGTLWRTPKWFGSMGPKRLDLLKNYQSELLNFNRKINLIGISTVSRADFVHFADSILGSYFAARSILLSLGGELIKQSSGSAGSAGQSEALTIQSDNLSSQLTIKAEKERLNAALDSQNLSSQSSQKSGVSTSLLDIQSVGDQNNAPGDSMVAKSDFLEMDWAAEIDGIDSGFSNLITGDPIEVADFGSGNGFPGLVFGILFPSVEVKLIDVDQKKCEVLKIIVDRLGLTNVQVIRASFNVLSSQKVQFKYGISRALAPLTKGLVMLSPLIEKDGVVFHMKSEEWGREITQLPTQLCSIWKPKILLEYRLPDSEIKHALVTTQKIK